MVTNEMLWPSPWWQVSSTRVGKALSSLQKLMNHKALLWSYLIPDPWVIPLILWRAVCYWLCSGSEQPTALIGDWCILHWMTSLQFSNSNNKWAKVLYFLIVCYYNHFLSLPFVKTVVLGETLSYGIGLLCKILQNINISMYKCHYYYNGIVLNPKDSNLALRGRLQGTESRMQVPDAGSASSTMTNGLSSSVTTRRCWASSGGLRNGP